MLRSLLIIHSGGFLGFFCRHQYAHATDQGRKSLPAAPKGVDLAIFSAFNALGLKTGIHPIVRNCSGQWGGLSARKLRAVPDDHRLDEFLNNLNPENETDCDSDVDDCYKRVGERGTSMRYFPRFAY